MVPATPHSDLYTNFAQKAVAWFAVLFRLWVRIRIVKKFGWDDGFVLLAQVCTATLEYDGQS